MSLKDIQEHLESLASEYQGLFNRDPENKYVGGKSHAFTTAAQLIGYERDERRERRRRKSKKGENCQSYLLAEKQPDKNQWAIVLREDGSRMPAWWNSEHEEFEIHDEIVETLEDVIRWCALPKFDRDGKKQEDEWYDPNEVMPPDDERVLVTLYNQPERYIVAWRHDHHWSTDFLYDASTMVVARWRRLTPKGRGEF